MSRQTTHPNKRSRRERALAQREAEFNVWVGGNAATVDMANRCGSYGKGCSETSEANDKKANIAARDVTALKTKLGVRDEA